MSNIYIYIYLDYIYLSSDYIYISHLFCPAQNYGSTKHLSQQILNKEEY